MDRAARSLLAPRERGALGPGSVVVLQLPNWVDAGIAFWASAYLVAAVVPIVHYYGAEEVDYSFAPRQPMSS